MMLTQAVLTGIVLSAMPVGDFDKRLVILTKERGKITAFAKGARKQNSPLLASSTPFSFGEFVLYEGRNSYTIISTNITNYFAKLKEDLESVAYAYYFCEFADFFTHENMLSYGILKLLYQSFRALSETTIQKSLIRYIFELKILSLNGEAPQVFECIKCKNQSTLILFSVEDGGLFCENCKEAGKRGISMSSSAIYTMQYIISSNIEKLFTFMVTDDVYKELEGVMECWKKRYVEKEFKSLEMLPYFK